jgi:trehalose 6-phosphate synthase
VRALLPNGLPDQALQAFRRHLFVVSNRGPVQFHRGASGRFSTSKSSGGLATALVSAAKHSPMTWIAVAGNEDDRAAFADRPHRTLRLDGVAITARYVPVSDRSYRQYYDEISNRYLWFLQHFLYAPERTPNFGASEERSWQEGYVTVNRAVAEAVIEELQELSPDERAVSIVLLQDYHLYLAPGMIRAALPDVTMGHFVHIPWPSARYWRFAPEHMARAIVASMLENDIVGFQTEEDARSFAGCVQMFIPGARASLDPSAGLISWRRRDVEQAMQEFAGTPDVSPVDDRPERVRLTQARVYPIGIDPEHVRALATSSKAESDFKSIAGYFKRRGVKTILRVDRLEPTKNIVRGLKAFDLLLDQHPKLAGHVCFIMMLVPSREGVMRYRSYARQVTKLVQKINDKHGKPDEPVVLHVTGNNQARALAAMRHYDVLLVNSLMDGMHLGAKEGAAVNEHNGVLVISRNAGVYNDFADGACLSISPLDLQETADRLYEALAMPKKQRHAMALEARLRATANTVLDWLMAQLDDLAGVADARAAGTRTIKSDFVSPDVLEHEGDLMPVPLGADAQSSYN